jgi:DNA-binding MarR family transcriptional regulator
MFRAVNDEMAGSGLSVARAKVLRRLCEQGPTRQSVLATNCALSPHSITDIVDGLERLGLAERRPDPVDRRAKLVAITDAGRTALHAANATWERLLTQIFGSVSGADRKTLLRLVGSLDVAAQELIAASAAAGAPAVPA